MFYKSKQILVFWKFYWQRVTKEFLMRTGVFHFFESIFRWLDEYKNLAISLSR